jgi:hypothetical protein
VLQKQKFLEYVDGEKKKLELKHDQQALITFKAQSENFKKPMEESAYNPCLKNYYDKRLKKCYELWAEELTKIDLKEENVPTSKPPLISAFQQQLDTIETKIDLLCQATHAENQGSVLSSNDPRRKELKDRYDKWNGFKTKISELRQDYEKNIKQKFRSIDEEVAEFWVQAYGQMKEENRELKSENWLR